MELSYGDKKITFPSSLSEITLGQRIEFDRTYSAEIAAMRNAVYRKDDEGNVVELDESEIFSLNVAVAIRNFSFFTGVPVAEVEKNIALGDVVGVFNSCFEQIYLEQDNIELQDGYYFNGEVWYIQNPQLTYESDITFNELITSKQVIKQMHELGAGNWEAVRSLACVFFRREGEQFDEKWLTEGSERMNMMDDLPMDIATHIGFFLQNSMSLYQKISPFSAVAEAEKART